MPASAWTARAISIHAPREGSDTRTLIMKTTGFDFYPRSPRGERRKHPDRGYAGDRFLSTLPARGATAAMPGQGPSGPVISIHAPREGSDGAVIVTFAPMGAFLSTLPARGATSAR